MEWMKINTNGILRGSLARSTDVVQLTWIKLLALMSETHSRNGRFEFAQGKPYPLEYIAMNCGITKEILEGCLCEYEEDINPETNLPRIQWDGDKTLILTNWIQYQKKPEKTKESIIQEQSNLIVQMATSQRLIGLGGKVPDIDFQM